MNHRIAINKAMGAAAAKGLHTSQVLI